MYIPCPSAPMEASWPRGQEIIPSRYGALRDRYFLTSCNFRPFSIIFILCFINEIVRLLYGRPNSLLVSVFIVRVCKALNWPEPDWGYIYNIYILMY
jgi:hypothetical protein